MTRRRRPLTLALAAVTAVVVLFATVFPTRTFLAQRSAVGAAEERLTVLTEQNQLLEERARLLEDDAEIERLAREEYHLVRPGEKAYAVLPPSAPPAPPPAVGIPPPADDGNPVQRAWKWLTSRF
ncbi:MAG: septum formation initiator family protein [Actinomycetota bacterium]|nr:septum formation initiator family protein [Actinomycetota bacterium]